MTSEEMFKESAEYLAGKLEERKNELVLRLPEIYITDVRAAYYAGLKSGLRHHSHDYLVKTANQKDQLTKAKEIIKKMLYEYQRLCLIKKETITDVEQFLTEVQE